MTDKRAKGVIAGSIVAAASMLGVASAGAVDVVPGGPEVCDKLCPGGGGGPTVEVQLPDDLFVKMEFLTEQGIFVKFSDVFFPKVEDAFFPKVELPVIDLFFPKVESSQVSD